MCGLLFTTNPNITKTQFTSSLALMKARGPDSPLGYYNAGGVQLGHNRLKIIDLDNRSNQPFTSTCGRYIIVFNGEIYNFRLIQKKFKFRLRTESDTEILLQLYIKLGVKMLDELNGMFAFVIFDTKTKNTFIARDRLGIKPLYIHQKNNHLIVASEIAAILNLLDTVSFDEVGIRQYKKLRAFFNGHTLYKDVDMLEPGHCLINNKKICYWKIEPDEKDPPEDEELRDLIASSISLRTMADVPLGSYLSGGVDSSIIASTINNGYTWTVGFDNHNEFPFARQVADQLNVNHQEIITTKEEFISMAKLMIDIRKEPLSVPNEVLLYLMTKKAKNKNTVILSGEGADELFFGYDRIFKWSAESSNFDIRQFAKLYAYGSHDDIEIIENVLEPYRCYSRSIDIVAMFFQHAHLHGLLRRLDNATMMCSVEARVPFVDHRLVERMCGVPFQYRMSKGVVKAPLKRIFSNILPQSIIERKKVGFPVPLDEIFYGYKGETSMDKWLNFNLATIDTSI